MTGKQKKNSQATDAASEVIGEIQRLNRELRAFVAVALQHGLRDYCEARHPELTAELEKYYAHAQRRAKHKYDQILTRIGNVPVRELLAHAGATVVKPDGDAVIVIRRCIRSNSRSLTWLRQC